MRIEASSDRGKGGGGQRVKTKAKARPKQNAHLSENMTQSPLIFPCFRLWLRYKKERASRISQKRKDLSPQDRRRFRTTMC